MRGNENAPEDQQAERADHEPYASLCALAAGGFLDGEEFAALQNHLKDCSDCRADYRALSQLVTRELPQGESSLRQRLAEMRAKPLPNSRERFLRRAQAEGLVFSREVVASSRSNTRYLRALIILTPAAAVIIGAVSLMVHHRRVLEAAPSGDATAKQIIVLKQENSTLTASVSQLNESLAADKREINTLRAQLGTMSATAESLRRNSEPGREETERSRSQNAQLTNESNDQEKLLAQARDEAARVSQMHVNDQDTLIEQQLRIADLSNKLRLASATLDMERQLAAAGSDIRELMGARQLHVIDVHDTNSNGAQNNAFGRVFLTEGKSLTFYAFDLNQDQSGNAARRFQVWAASATGKDSIHSLGQLHADSKAPGRWVLRVEDPELLKEINSVFVTSAATTDGKQPVGQKMLHAYLGQANHP